MEKLRNNFIKVVMLTLVVGLFTLSSCKDDETADFAAPTITVTPGTVQLAPNTKQTFSIAVSAEGNIGSIKLGDTEIKSYTTDTKADAFSYEYTVPATQAEGTLTLTFTVTDKQGTPETGTTTVAVTVTKTPKETVTVDANITANTTWSASKYYLVKGNIFVQSGVTLTIEPGTIILGDKVTKGALIVNRGAKIEAKGTAAAPIIFTSSAPKGFRNYGDWGGVVLLGKAVNNQAGTQNIEGITATGTENGVYGAGTVTDGSTDADNTGNFYYVRIEFAGIALSTNNELNGLTMGSVGSGTTIHHVQVSYSGDDSFEWFGGTVGSQYLVAYRSWDDDFDTDFGYRGSNQYLASFRDPVVADISGSTAFESDNMNGGTNSNTPLTAAKFSNVTAFGPFVYAPLSNGALAGGNVSNNYINGLHIRRNTAIQIYNSVFVGWGKTNGINFEGANTAAVFKGNYMGRIVGTLKAISGSNGYSDANFATDNPTIETTQSTVDLSAKIAGLTGAATLATPSALLATSSPLLTAGSNTTVPTGLSQTAYIGAFDATNNWLTGWTNFDPNNTAY